MKLINYAWRLFIRCESYQDVTIRYFIILKERLKREPREMFASDFDGTILMLKRIQKNKIRVFFIVRKTVQEGENYPQNLHSKIVFFFQYLEK